MIEELIKQLKIDEGTKLFPYKDSLGLYTIGTGRCLETKGLSEDECDYIGVSLNDFIEQLKITGITQEQADYLLGHDIDDSINDLYSHLPWTKLLPEIVQMVLINMCFNMGIYGLIKFKNTLGFIQSGQYKEASIEMLNSKWAKQVGERAIRLSENLKSIP